MINNTPDSLHTAADGYFQRELGVTLAELLEPIGAGQPAGICLKRSGVHRAIQHARQEDDASLPLGDWERTLKRADWQLVSETCVEALRDQSKDLQLAAWLLEAEIHRRGFAGIAPCFVLIDALLARFGRELHPQEPPAQVEHRANIVRSINRRVVVVAKQVPITACGGEVEYAWADREAAKQRARESMGVDIAALAAVDEAIARTPVARFEALASETAPALEALKRLCDTADGYFGDEVPSLIGMETLLVEIATRTERELQTREGRRGNDTAALIEDAPSEGHSGVQLEFATTSSHECAIADFVANRTRAYKMIETASRILIEIEPHSPAPYLSLKAVEWGNLNAPDLYKIIFDNLKGIICINDLMK